MTGSGFSYYSVDGLSIVDPYAYFSSALVLASTTQVLNVSSITIAGNIMTATVGFLGTVYLGDSITTAGLAYGVSGGCSTGSVNQSGYVSAINTGTGTITFPLP